MWLSSKQRLKLVPNLYMQRGKAHDTPIHCWAWVVGCELFHHYWVWVVGCELFHHCNVLLGRAMSIMMVSQETLALVFTEPSWPLHRKFLTKCLTCLLLSVWETREESTIDKDPLFALAISPLSCYLPPLPLWPQADRHQLSAPAYVFSLCLRKSQPIIVRAPPPLSLWIESMQSGFSSC